MALIAPSEDPPREPPKVVRKAFVSLRCDSWQQAIQKVTRIGQAEEKLHREDRRSKSDSGEGTRWQFMGVNAVIPIPSKLENGQVISDFEETEFLPALEDVFRGCESYWGFESYIGEEITGNYYRTSAELNDSNL